MEGFAALVGVILVSLGLGTRQHLLWQADLQIRSLTISEEKGNLTARVVVASEFGEALAARLEILLPVGVGIVHLGRGCIAGPGAPGVPSLRARVICTIGTLRPHDLREFSATTTAPPSGVSRGFGAIATSDTPDPMPRNNFAEKVIP